MVANENAKAVAAMFEGAADFETRSVTAGGVPVTVYFIDGLTSGGDIADFVLRPLGCCPEHRRKYLSGPRRARCGARQ